MRQILFRAWLKNYHEMHIVETLDMQDNEVFINRINGNGGYHNIKDIELMQYTGLDDSSGKKIYEGDVLHNEQKLSYIVEFYNGSFFAIHEDRKPADRYILWEYINIIGSCEVVGNIYDNR